MNNQGAFRSESLQYKLKLIAYLFITRISGILLSLLTVQIGEARVGFCSGQDSV